jgi:hypothetical protein
MDFIQGKDLTRKEILAAFNVNEVVLGDFGDTKSFEGSKAAHKAFWEECLLPKMFYFENLLWSKFFSKIGQRRGKGRIWAEFDTANVGPLQEDYKEKVDMAHIMFNMGWPINMINKRLKLGMKEVPWGEEWWVPGGYLPVDMIREGATRPNTPAEVNTPAKPKPSKTAFYCEVIEEEFKGKFNKLLFEIRKRSLACFFDQKNWDDVLQASDFIKLRENICKVYAIGISSGVEFQQSVSGIVVEDVDFSEYQATRSLFVIDNLKSFLQEVIFTVKTIKDVEKIRELFNILSVKMDQLAEREAKIIFEFGEQAATEKAQNELKELLQKELVVK